MSLTMRYRGIEFVRYYLGKFIKTAFYAYNKGDLIFYDGTNKISFSRMPDVVLIDNWEQEKLPSVLVSEPTGEFEYRSFTKDLVRDQTNEDLEEGETGYRFWGGDINLSTDLVVRATSPVERDRMMDTVALLIAHPNAKDYLEQHDIKLSAPPSIGGYTKVPSPDVDPPVYEGRVTVRTQSGWQDKEELEPTLLDIIVDLEAVITFDT